MSRARGAVVVLGVLAALAVASPAAAQTPTSLPCQPPITVCETSAPASPSPSPSRTATPRPTPQPTPSAEPTPEPTPEPSVVVVEPVPSSGAATTGVPSPTTAGSATPSASASPSSGYRLASGRVPVAGAFAAVAVLLLATPLLLTVLAARLRPAAVAVPGGTSMPSSSRTRLYVGVGCLAAAALTALIGWLKISDEPLLNFQVPLLASAGLAVVLLSVVGGSLLVADQMRGDDRRLDDLEEAVRSLAAALAPSIESPPRRAAADPDPDSDATPTP